MPEPFIHHRRVEFAETDMAGLLHFSEFFRYMESAEHALLRSIGRSVHEARGDRIVSFPRVHATADFQSPLRFEDEVTVHVTVREIGRKSITYAFAFFKKAGDRQVPCATGSITVVCIAKDPGVSEITAIEVPSELAEELKAFMV